MVSLLPVFVKYCVKFKSHFYYYFVHFQVHPLNFFDADPESNARQRHSKITATVGLVVHAAGKGL